MSQHLMQHMIKFYMTVTLEVHDVLTVGTYSEGNLLVV